MDPKLSPAAKDFSLERLSSMAGLEALQEIVAVATQLGLSFLFPRKLRQTLSTPAIGKLRQSLVLHLDDVTG